MAGFYPFNPALGQQFQTGAEGTQVDGAYIAHYQISAANAKANDTDGVHAAITCATTQTVSVTTGFTNPLVPRNITATSGGTAADIKAVQVIITGTDFAGEAITETLPVFTENSATTVSGSKAFATVTKVEVPAMDGTGATVIIGFGNKLGIPYKLLHNTVLMAFLDNTKEGTAPTVAVSASDISGNTVTLNSSLVDSKAVDIYFIV